MSFWIGKINFDRADEVFQQQDVVLKRLEELESAIEIQKNDIKTYVPPKPIIGAIASGIVIPGAIMSQPLEEVVEDASGSETEVLDGLDLLNDSDDGVARSLKMSSLSGQVFVCTNKWCREKGSDATMATFSFLTPPNVAVVGVNCLGRCNRGPNCRILNSNGAFVEASMVRSVESVVDLLQDHLDLKVNITSAEVLRLNYEGNVYLRNGDLDQAISCYDRALLLGDPEQEGVLLVMRGTALLQRAYLYRMRQRDVLGVAEGVLPTSENIRSYMDLLYNPGLSPPIKYKVTMESLTRLSSVFTNLDLSPRWAEAKLRWPEVPEGPPVMSGHELLSKALFLWSLYEHSLMRALTDLLAATIVMPGFAQAWRRAGDALGDLRQYDSAIEYYEVAMRLDTSLSDALVSASERLRLTKKILENAASKGYSADSILALVED